MEALVKLDVPDTVMEIYFSCPLCQHNFLSAERVHEHIPNCCMLSSSSLIPSIESYSSSNPPAVDLSVHTEEFPIRQEKDSELFREAGHTDCQDETEGSTLRSPVEICQNVPNHKEMELETIRPEPKIFGVSKDLNSIQNRESTSKGVQHQHEHCLMLEPNYLCETCGKCFASGASFIHHMRSHRQPAPGFQCCFPGCVQTFKSTAARWHHQKTHSSGAWNECAWRPRILRKNQPLKSIPRILIPRSGHLLRDNQGLGSHLVTEYTPGEFSVTDQTKESNLRSPVEICQNVPNHQEMELKTIRPEPKIFGVSKDLNSIQNRESTSEGVQHQQEHCLRLESNYLCETCGKYVASGASFIHHMRSHHQPAPGFQCCFPGCVETFKSTVARWYHHKTHPSGVRNEYEWRPRILKKNQPPKNPQTTTTMTESEHLFLDNQDIKNQPMAHNNNGESSMTDQIDTSSENTGAISSTGDIQSQDPAQVVSCCYPECSTNFSSEFELWIHQKTHPEGLWNGIKETSGIVGQNQTSEDSPSINMPVIDNGGTKNNAVEQVFTGRRFKGLKITGPRKLIAKKIIPNAIIARQPSQAPENVQIINSSKSDQNISRGSETGGQSPGELVVFTCGICDDGFENSDNLKCHMLTTHAGPEESQAEELEEIGTSVDNSFGSVQSNCQGDQVPAEVKENEATSNPPENSYGRIRNAGPAPRYPIVKLDGKKYYYCGFPGCDAVFFNNRNSRYIHHKKFHSDAYRYMLTNLAARSMQLEENSEFSMQDDEEVSASAQLPMPVLSAFLDEDFETDEQEMPDLHNQTMETFQFTVTDRSPMQQTPLINEDSSAENIFQTDNGGLGSPLRTEASTSNLDPVRPNMSNQTSEAERVKDQKFWSNGRRTVYPTIKIGTKTLYCCGSPGCKGVFNSCAVRYMHHKKHRRGLNYVNSKLKLTEDGKVWDSVEGCHVTE